MKVDRKRCGHGPQWPPRFAPTAWPALAPCCFPPLSMGEASGPLVPKLGCGASRFCFTWWLLATCFLHSAHSVSHFTLPQAERSIHLVQTLLTGLGRRRPLLGRMRGGHEGHWSGQLLTDMSLAPPPPFPCSFLAL